MKFSGLSFLKVAVLGGLLGTQTVSAVSYSLDKLYDFRAPGQPGYNYIRGIYDAPLVFGTGAATTLWFTAQRGGLDDEGDLASFNLTTQTLTVHGLNFGGASEVPPGSGNFVNDPARPEGTPVYDNGNGSQNFLYFTTVGGGLTGNSSVGGTLVRYDMDANNYETVWNAPVAGVAGGRQPRGTVVVVDRGSDGKDLYFSNSGAGEAPGTAAGGIMRYNTNTGLTSVVIDFAGAPGAASPYDGFVQVGDRLYMTTFTGGDITAGATGSGTLGYVDISDPSNPLYQSVANMPGSASNGIGSSTRLPASTPIYDANRNALYFTTVGSNTAPGAIMKFDLTSEELITLYELPIGASSGANLEGRQGGYNSPYLLDDYLYYVTRNGGENNLGTINRFNLLTNENTVLFHLANETGGVVYGDFAFSDFDFDLDGIADQGLYFMTYQGGEYGYGTILRLTIIPEPSSVAFVLAATGLLAMKRRRSTRQIR